jgi:flagellar FliL protein
MAKEQKAQDKEVNEKEAGGRNKKKIILILVAIVILLGGAAGAYFFFFNDTKEYIEKNTAQSTGNENGESNQLNISERDLDAKLGNATYVPMPKPFRFNVPGNSRDRLVEIRVQLLIRGAEDGELTKKHIPLIESTLLSVFSEMTAENLMTKAGKESLKQESLMAIQENMQDVESKNLVEKVLFTGFVMQ